jgi:metallo-beta-lactamase family protein
MQRSITFHGAAETVTGSRHLISVNGKNILVDCGLFQGSRELRDRNWEPFPIDPREIDAIVITHAHQDHIGNLPRSVAQGYSGPIYATRATIALCKISLPDSGRLQEEEARRANRHGSRHQPAMPLYTEQDAYASHKLFKAVSYDTWTPLPGRAQFRFLPAGHILGSAFAEITFDDGVRILMGGDLGRYDTPLIKDPTPIDAAEFLVVESTYGDRSHAHENVMDKLSELLNETMQTGGALLTPSFSIGRTQELLYYIDQLQEQGRAPRIPIYIDSPMATSVTHVYSSSVEERDDEAIDIYSKGGDPLLPAGVTFVRDQEQSKALNRERGPLMIIAGSGMCNGGRIIHHLKQRIALESTIVLFTGYQAQGTLGRRILEHEEEVMIHGELIPVRARVEKLNSLSAHADRDEIMRWLRTFKSPPQTTFIVHGEPSAQHALREKIELELGWKVEVPRHHEEFVI